VSSSRPTRLPAVSRSCTLLSGAAIATLIVAGTAQATTTLTVHGGFYGPKEALVEAHKSAAVNVIVIDHGKKLKDVGVSCSSGPEPGQGLRPEVGLTVRVPGTVAITRSGTFSYSGQVTLIPEETQSEVGATTSLSIKGKFARGKIKLDKTIALTGTVSASICASTTTPQFSLVWDSASTLT
jgi:hypothetical protein